MPGPGGHHGRPGGPGGHRGPGGPGGHRGPGGPGFGGPRPPMGGGMHHRPPMPPMGGGMGPRPPHHHSGCCGCLLPVIGVFIASIVAFFALIF